MPNERLRVNRALAARRLGLQGFQRGVSGHVGLAADHGGDQGGPAGLMISSQSHAAVGVEVFVEQDQILPVRIIAVAGLCAVGWPGTGFVTFEQRNATLFQLAGDFH